MISLTIFHFIRMSKFSLLNGVTVVILVTFGKIGLLFSVYNISKNYTCYIDTWTDIYKIYQSGFFSSPVSHLNIHSYIHTNIYHTVWCYRLDKTTPKMINLYYIGTEISRSEAYFRCHWHPHNLTSFRFSANPVD